MHPQPHLLFIILHHHSSSYFLLHPLLIYSLLLFFRATLSSSFSLLDYLNCSKRAASVRRSSRLAQLPVIWPCHFACDQSPNGLAYLKGVERKSSERAWTLHVGSWSINLCMEHVGLNQDKWPEFRAGENLNLCAALHKTNARLAHENLCEPSCCFKHVMALTCPAS